MNRSHPFAFRLLEFVTAIILGTSVLALIGNLAHIPRLLAWDGGTPMSINTIFLELLEGIGFACLCVGLRRREPLGESPPIQIAPNVSGMNLLGILLALICGVLIWKRIHADLVAFACMSMTTFYFGSRVVAAGTSRDSKTK